MFKFFEIKIKGFNIQMQEVEYTAEELRTNLDFYSIKFRNHINPT